MPHSLHPLLATLAALASLAVLGAATAPATLETALTKARSAVPTSFEATYSDMHPLWGGVAVTIRGDGKAHLETRKRGQTTPTVTDGTATATELKDLVGLLVDKEGWKQLTPDRAPVPDESRATLQVSLEGASGGFWEWYNDLDANQRLSAIRDRMTAIAAN